MTFCDINTGLIGPKKNTMSCSQVKSSLIDERNILTDKPFSLLPQGGDIAAGFKKKKKKHAQKWLIIVILIVLQLLEKCNRLVLCQMFSLACVACILCSFNLGEGKLLSVYCFVI